MRDGLGVFSSSTHIVGYAADPKPNQYRNGHVNRKGAHGRAIPSPQTFCLRGEVHTVALWIVWLVRRGIVVVKFEKLKAILPFPHFGNIEAVRTMHIGIQGDAATL